ncbi:MAG: hypothetical protein DVS81_10930 [Candidatus Accumulibacter meliphilus]|uniref:Uncharacterized protein n=1 Tax=Candidatus Accumulibacter meliphilus TaxID=2211374 RepID=A0A369XKA0_9PROT|nr:MAG: hypothetical protein DVS81_10930 [Candidatus Accumulibacter meliphilus]
MPAPATVLPVGSCSERPADAPWPALARPGPPWPVLSQHAPPGVGQAARRRWSRPAVRRDRDLPAMSKACRRPTRAGIREQRSHKRRQEKALNAKRRALGFVPTSPAPLPNSCSPFATIAEEQAAREDAVSKQVRLLRKELPALLAQLTEIPDPRDPGKRRHKLTVLLLWGLLMFVFQFASPREANREMTRPQFLANLQLLFPEIETLSHADTLFTDPTPPTQPALTCRQHTAI